MSEKNKIIYKLFKSILIGLLFPTIFFYLFLEVNNFNPIKKEFLLITESKIRTTGLIIKAKHQENYIEMEGLRNQYEVLVLGYIYYYTFISNKGEKIITEDFIYGELPNNKNISQIPFQVNIEYLEENPKINRIAGLDSNNESLLDLLENELMLPLIFFIGSCCFTFLFVKGGIKEYIIEIKANKLLYQKDDKKKLEVDKRDNKLTDESTQSKMTRSELLKAIAFKNVMESKKR